MASPTPPGTPQIALGHAPEGPLSGDALLPTITPLEAPPVGSFTSREELFSYINIKAYHRGYAFSTVKSYKVKGLMIVVYGCDRYKIETKETLKKRVRETATRVTGYVFFYFR